MTLPAEPTAPPAPALWNPNAAGLWSVLLTPTFGAWLHMRNWQALGDEKRAAESRGWAWANVAMIVAFIVLGFLWPESKLLDKVSRGAGIGLLVGWWLSAGRVQKALVAERYGKQYPRRGWGAPLGAALLVVIALLALVFVAAMLIGISETGGAGNASSPHL